MYGLNANLPSSAYSPVVNTDSDEAVPPFGLMQSTGVTTNGAANIKRPDGTHADLLVNGSTAIPKSGTDNRGAGHRVFPTIVAYQADSPGAPEPQPNEIWGPRSGSWYLHKSGRGFRIIGGALNGTANVMPSPGEDPRRVQLLDTLSPCGHARAIEMNYDSVNDNYCTFGDQITVYDSASIIQTEIDPGFWLWATFQPDSQRWEVEAVGSDGCCGGSGSGSGIQCVTNVGGIDFSKLPQFDPDGGQVFIIGEQDGCLVRVPTNLCNRSGSGS